MNGLLENAENYQLCAYQEAVDSFEQLEASFHQPLDLVRYTKKQLIDMAFNKIQNLLDLETLNHFNDTDICTALFFIREQLAKLNQEKCGIAKPKSVVPQSQSAQVGKKSNEDDKQFGEIVERTRVIPKLKGLGDIGGLVDIKKTLSAIIVLPIHQPQLYNGKKICNSILLYGPPGTGKTGLVHALAAEIGACLFSVTASDILSQYVGQTEKMTRALFRTVKKTRECSTILFMDEIDGLCRSRSDNESEWTRRLKSELMCQLSAIEDCPNLFLMCATNCPWDLDPAFLRRFQRRIYVPLPTRPDRFELLQLLTKDTPLESTSNYWGPLLSKTEHYSGSDLTDLVRNALNIPITELIDNRVWRVVGDNVYQPALDCLGCEPVVYCDLYKLPAQSVQARPVQVSDLMAAAGFVGRTVSDTDLHKYDRFVSNTV